MKQEEKAAFKKLGDIIKTQMSAAEQLIIDAYKAITKPAEIKAKDVKTKDGLVTISHEGETLAVGMPVMDNTTGTPAPLMDGEYTLEDGTVITVASGMVADLKAAQAAEVEPADMSAIKKDFATQMSAQRIALEKQVSDQAKEIKDMKGIIVKMNEILVELKEAPIGGSIEDEAEPNEDWKKLPYEEMTNAQRVKFNRENKG